ncbi:MAG: HAD hydrolase-like protein [Acidimicrobiia bacterium]|nr:HAD hydrolase-like protein [Acidimicrobiia bacterium]
MDTAELRLFVFDLAGTTIADDGRVLRAFRSVAAREGLEADDAWLTSRMGWFKTRVFEDLLARNDRDPAQARVLTESFDRTIGDDYRADPPRPLAGAVDSMQTLRAAGTAIGFTTGFTRAVTDVVFGARPFGHDFTPDAVVASDEVERGRPAPDLVFEVMRRVGVVDPRTVGVAGDTPADLEAGTAAGCRVVVGVGHGTHTLAQLASAPHTHLLPDLGGLVAAISETP